VKKCKLVIVIMVLLIIWGTWVNYQPHRQEEIIAGEGVTEVSQLSDYYPDLAGSNGDTKIYTLKGEDEGGTAVILGGSHANEIAGVIASINVVESGQVEAGRVMVIPHANASAITNRKPLQGDPWRITLDPEDPDSRHIRYGSRYTHPLDQWPTPEEYTHVSGELDFPGTEGRNLNRVHPGQSSGTLTEQISYALFALLEEEEVDMVFDLHEAGVDSNLPNHIITHPESIYLGSEVYLDMEFAGYSFHLEQSNMDFRGLSHREMGEKTEAYAILSETANPYQGNYFIDSSPEAIMSGEEPGYQRIIAERNVIPAKEDLAMNNRVAAQLMIINQSIKQLGSFYPEKEINFNFPEPEEVRDKGVVEFLN